MEVLKGILAVIVLFGLSLLMIFKPEMLWELQHMFSVKGGEPTDFYLASTRIGGVVFLLIAVFAAVSFLFF